MKRTPCQLLSLGVALSCFRAVLQTVAQETILRVEERMNSSKQQKCLEENVTQSVKG